MMRTDCWLLITSGTGRLMLMFCSLPSQGAIVTFGAADAHDAHGYWSRLSLVLLVVLGAADASRHA